VDVNGVEEENSAGDGDYFEDSNDYFYNDNCTSRITKFVFPVVCFCFAPREC